MTIVTNRKADPDVLDAIELTVLCQEFNCLPGAGGLLDQDAKHVWIMQAVVEAQLERDKLERKRMNDH